MREELNVMTRRDLVLLGLTSAAAALALLSPGRASRAFAPIKDVDRGRIYAYAWAGGDGRRELVQGIFALDPARMEWTRVADQSDSATFDTYFRVSRDGRLLAVARRADRGSDNPELVGVSVRDLTRGGAIRTLDSVAGNPIWSADGKRFLVAVSKRNLGATKPFRMESWIVNIDGTMPSKLPIPETDEVSDWSPDGSWVLTISRRDQGVGYQIYRMKLDGTDARRLTSTARGAINIDGRISPDGRLIAYFRVGDSQSGIWAMDADGTNPRRIFELTLDAYPGAPAWSPDGRKIAISVHAKRKGEQGNELQSNHRLILLDVAGGDPVKVAPPLADGLGDPQWAVSWKP